MQLIGNGERVNGPQHFPTVTVAIPARNEAANIERVIRGFLASSYPNIVEILVADSGSTDATPTLVQDIARRSPKVIYLQNSAGLRATGLNLMLANAKGDIFLRADAHAEYAEDYVSCCVDALVHSQALNVGGAQRTIAKTAFQAGVALAYYGWSGHGGAKYRNPNYTGFATTVYLGCFWRNHLLQYSGYGLDILSEDAELNLRLKQNAQKTMVEKQPHQRPIRAKQLIYISSQIKVWYYPRDKWLSLWKQYFHYGSGRYLLTKKYQENLQLRGRLPFFILLATIVPILIDLVFPQLNLCRPTLLILIGLLLLPCLESLYLNIKLRKVFLTEIWRGQQHKIPSLWSRWLFCTVALLTMPVAHGCGYGYQYVRCKILLFTKQ